MTRVSRTSTCWHRTFAVLGRVMIVTGPRKDCLSERIESHGHQSPSEPDVWFDQDEDEDQPTIWVAVFSQPHRAH